MMKHFVQPHNDNMLDEYTVDTLNLGLDARKADFLSE